MQKPLQVQQSVRAKVGVAEEQELTGSYGGSDNLICFSWSRLVTCLTLFRDRSFEYRYSQVQN